MNTQAPFIAVETFVLPAHWACALINGDFTGLDDEDNAAIDAFADFMLAEYGQCWALSCDEYAGFTCWHDAEQLGVLACHCLTFVFDVTPRDGRQSAAPA